MILSYIFICNFNIFILSRWFGWSTFSISEFNTLCYTCGFYHTYAVSKRSTYSKYFIFMVQKCNNHLLNLCFLNFQIAFFLGIILNELVNFLLKNWFCEPRPLVRNVTYQEYGMPSSHSQFMWFFATYCALFVIIRYVVLFIFQGKVFFIIGMSFSNVNHVNLLLTGSIIRTIIHIWNGCGKGCYYLWQIHLLHVSLTAGIISFLFY